MKECSYRRYSKRVTCIMRLPLRTQILSFVSNLRIKHNCPCGSLPAVNAMNRGKNTLPNLRLFFLYALQASSTSTPHWRPHRCSVHLSSLKEIREPPKECLLGKALTTRCQRSTEISVSGVRVSAKDLKANDFQRCGYFASDKWWSELNFWFRL